MTKLIKKAWDNEIVRFLVVGGINTLFGYGMFAFFTYLGINYVLAVLYATILGIAFNYNTIGRIVFGKKDSSLVLKFVCVYVAIYLLNIIGLRILHAAGLNSYISGGILLLPIAFTSYILNSKFVFSAKSKSG